VAGLERKNRVLNPKERETLDEYSIRQLTQGLQLESPCHSGPTAGAIASSVSQGAPNE
jgi:membrane protease FtsH catalytic subunit (EC 3.4.24.-)